MSKSQIKVNIYRYNNTGFEYEPKCFCLVLNGMAQLYAFKDIMEQQ